MNTSGSHSEYAQAFELFRFDNEAVGTDNPYAVKPEEKLGGLAARNNEAKQNDKES